MASENALKISCHIHFGAKKHQIFNLTYPQSTAQGDEVFCLKRSRTTLTISKCTVIYFLIISDLFLKISHWLFQNYSVNVFKTLVIIRIHQFFHSFITFYSIIIMYDHLSIHLFFQWKLRYKVLSIRFEGVISFARPFQYFIRMNFHKQFFPYHKNEKNVSQKFIIQ